MVQNYTNEPNPTTYHKSKLFCVQSYKYVTIVIYNSRVVRKPRHFLFSTTLDL